MIVHVHACLFHNMLFLFSIGSDRTINGHVFKIHSYSAPVKCDFCTKYMLGFIRQGLKCKSELKDPSPPYEQDDLHSIYSTCTCTCRLQ